MTYELPRARAIGEHDRAAAAARIDHEERVRARPPTARRSSIALPPPAEPRQSRDRAPGRSTPGSCRDRVDGAEAAAPPWTRLEQRRKRRTIIAVAAACELAGFVWRSPKPSEPKARLRTTSRRLGRWRPGTRGEPATGPMSNPPQGRPRPILDSGSPRRTMVLHHPPTRAYQSDRASRTASRTATHRSQPHNPQRPTQTREINDPHLTTRSPYQIPAQRSCVYTRPGHRQPLNPALPSPPVTHQPPTRSRARSLTIDSKRSTEAVTDRTRHRNRPPPDPRLRHSS
jgi:hypothetical protein